VHSADAPRLYAISLAGSAAGCLLALDVLAVWGSVDAAFSARVDGWLASCELIV